MNKYWLLPAIFSLIPPCLHAQDGDQPIGVVLAASGSVIATELNGDRRPLQRSSALYEGDTITTGSQSRVQFRFSDNGRVALQPESSFFVETHRFSGQEDGTEQASYELVRGGLQAITGLIGHTNKEQYNVNTPIANIGLRGTHWTATYCDTNCDGNPPGLYGGVADGGIDVCNAAGCTAIDADTYFYTPNVNSLTETLLAPPSVVFMDSAEPGSGSPTSPSDPDDAETPETAEQNESQQPGTPSVANASVGNNETSAASRNFSNQAGQPQSSTSGGFAASTSVGNSSGRNLPNENALQNSVVFAGNSASDNAFTSEPTVREASDRVSDLTDNDLEELGNKGNGQGQGQGQGNNGNDGSGNPNTDDDNDTPPGNNSGSDTDNGGANPPGNSGGGQGQGQGQNPGGGNSDTPGDLNSELTVLFGDDLQYQSNLEDSQRGFDAFWGRWAGPNSKGNQLNDHFAYSPDTTTTLPVEGTLSYQLLGATSPSDQIGKAGQVHAIHMLINFTAQSIQTMTFDLETGTSHWLMENIQPASLGNGRDINVALIGTCSWACAKKFESIEARGTSAVTLIGSNAEGAMGTYDFNAGSASATGAFILEADF